jgi:Domain of unknown function (DUF6430)
MKSEICKNKVLKSGLALNRAHESALALNHVHESDGELQTTVNHCVIKVISGRIENISRSPQCVIVLPCNEYFDPDCVKDKRDALGAYVGNVFNGRVDEFVTLVTDESRNKLRNPMSRQKTQETSAESFGPGKCLLLEEPLGDKTPIALVSTSTQMPGQGPVGQISFLFAGIRNLFERLADSRLDEVAMPILGAGRAGIGASLALVGLLLAIAEAARLKSVRPPRKVTLVVFKPDNNSSPQVDMSIVRRTLALIASSE